MNLRKKQYLKELIKMNELDKQKMIIRQSSLNRAIELFDINCYSSVTVNEITALAEVLTNYVCNGKTEDVKNDIDKMDKYLTKKEKK